MNYLEQYCGAGHEFTAQNTYTTKKGRQCKRCRADRAAAFAPVNGDRG